MTRVQGGAQVQGNIEKAWTADATAEDLVAQVRELLAEGATVPSVLHALQVEGLEPLTAEAFLRDLDGALPIAGAADAPLCAIEIRPVRAFLSQPVAQHLPQRSRELADALARHGLQPATAATVAAELASNLRRFAEVHSHRMRRLARQGMIAGLLFTSFFGWSALRPGHDGRVDGVTAAMTVLLAVYSAVLYRRHRAVG